MAEEKAARAADLLKVRAPRAASTQYIFVRGATAHDKNVAARGRSQKNFCFDAASGPGAR
jgi:hypothetical protein